jgi:hypothetical protein
LLFGFSIRAFWSCVAAAAAFVSWPRTVQASTIYVPDYSFESPVIGTNSPYAAPVLDSWQLSPQPGWYDPAGFGDSPWADLAGTFYNLPNYTNSQGTNTTFIFNCDGVQAAFMFGLPQLALSQDLSAKFNAGKTYTLTVGLIGGGGGMPLGSTLQLSLYYRDASSNMVIVAQTTVTNTTANFSSNTNFVDFQVQVPGVRPTDLWVGQNIGIQLLATPDPYNPGGYWDVDNVRLVEGVALNLLAPAVTNGQMQFAVQSEPGVACQVFATTNPSLPLAGWTCLGTVTNVTGNLPFVDQQSGLQQRFYIARPLP